MRWRQVRRGVPSWGRAVLLVAAAAASGAAASAQVLETLPLASTYGSGVHAYFAGDYDRSYEDLTAAIEAGSQDPRALYFRGLAAARLGRLDEAEADFSRGADLEARALGGWPVSRALERVQGHDRLRLERHRIRARVAALQQDLEAERMRYSDTAKAQDDVRRRRLPATVLPPPGGVRNLFEADSEAAPAPAEEERVVPPTGMELPPPDASAPAEPAFGQDPTMPADAIPFGVTEQPAAEAASAPVELEGAGPGPAVQ